MFAKFDRALARTSMALVVLGCVVVVVLFVLIISDVTIRTLGFDPPAYTIAVVEYGLLYFAMFAAPFLVRQRGHVTIEAVVSVLPVKVRRFLAKVVYVVCVAASLLFAYFSTRLLIEALSSMEVDIRGIDMPLWLQYFPMPIGFGMMALEFLRYLIGGISYYSYDLGEVKDGV